MMACVSGDMEVSLFVVHELCCDSVQPGSARTYCNPLIPTPLCGSSEPISICSEARYSALYDTRTYQERDTDRQTDRERGREREERIDGKMG